MNRLLRLLGGMVSLLLANAAIAQTANWSVSEATGRVVIRDASGDHAAKRGSIVPAGATVSTGPGARAVVVRGRDFVTVSASSRIRIPTADQARGNFHVFQEWGNAVFQIEKKPNPHFGVRTPYLAAVVKGTTFSITVTAQGASLQVVEGAVETSTSDGGARELIRPGIVASVTALDRYRLTIQGQDTRTIDSPQRPVTPTEPSPAPSGSSSATDTTQPQAAEGATPNTGDTASAAGTETSVIAQAIEAKPVDLGDATGGLVRGTTAVQLASVQIAMPVTARVSEAADTSRAPMVAAVANISAAPAAHGPPAGVPVSESAGPPAKLDSASREETGSDAAAKAGKDAAEKNDKDKPKANKPDTPVADGKSADLPGAGDKDSAEKAEKDRVKADKEAADAKDKAAKDRAKADRDAADAKDKAAKDAADAADKAAKDQAKADRDAADTKDKDAKDAANAADKAAKDQAEADRKAADARDKAAKDAADAADKAAKDQAKADRDAADAQEKAAADAAKADKEAKDAKDAADADKAAKDQAKAERDAVDNAAKDQAKADKDATDKAGKGLKDSTEKGNK